jgi:hypothetical protein
MPPFVALPPVGETPPFVALPPVGETPPAVEIPPVAETPPAVEPPPTAKEPPEPPVFPLPPVAPPPSGPASLMMAAGLIVAENEEQPQIATIVPRVIEFAMRMADGVLPANCGVDCGTGGVFGPIIQKLRPNSGGYWVTSVGVEAS